jgi:dihydroxy-acid dehydratase
MVYGGTIKPGHLADGNVTRYCFGVPVLRESMSPAVSMTSERSDIVQRACPGAGACGGMYTGKYDGNSH